MNASFVRKIIYMCAIVLMMIPLILLGLPASVDRSGQKAGGQLAQLRNEYKLSPANLGKIDPASESMRLATLGMTGVAANQLWYAANQFQKVEDYDAVSATCEQITKLQPNFIKVWEFQAHNLSYNISAEFDNYRHRYHWVRKGIEFLTDGTEYNDEEPRLFWNVGWFMGQKIGRADERRLFRQLFREDHEFHAALDGHVDMSSPEAQFEGQPDNWKVGRLWYLLGQELVDTKGAQLRGKSPLLFHSAPAMSLINHASDIEKEGYWDQPARLAWSEAHLAWVGDPQRRLRGYGGREIPTSWGTNIRLNDLEQVYREKTAGEKELDELVPGIRERIHEQKLAKLSPAERTALETPEEQRTFEQMGIVPSAEARAQVHFSEIASQAPADVRLQVRELSARLEELEIHANQIRRYRGVVNFEYWRTRCEVEQTKTATDARKYVFQADQALEDAKLEEAKEKYELAWSQWAIIFKQHPELMEDVTAQDLYKSVDNYRIVLEQNGEPWPPKDFALAPLLESRERRRGNAVPVNDPVVPPDGPPGTGGDALIPPPNGTPAADPPAGIKQPEKKPAGDDK